MVLQQKSGKPWSGANKIPNINDFLASLDLDKARRDEEIDQAEQANQEQEQNLADDGVTDHKNETKKRKGKTVTDPVTGKTVVIEDVNKEFMRNVDNPKLSVPNANLGKPTTVATSSTMPYEEYKEKQDITAPPDPIAPGSTSDIPIHGEKTNVLFHPTPSVSYEPMYKRVEKQAGITCAMILASIVVLGKLFGGSLKGMALLGMCLSSAVWLWMKEVVRSGREVEWSSEQLRGQTAVANLLPESVEWINTFLGVVWRLLNPDMFAAVADTIEDVMQASVPSVISNVRIAEIDQGSNPIRVLSLRALPDSKVQDLIESIKEENRKTKDPQEAAVDEEGGDYYNLEVSFAYHARPGGISVSSRARNMHMNLVFYLGIRGLVGVPLPIFVELQELVGTIRIRLMLTPEPPFAKSLTFTLMGVPHVQAGCIPMMKHGVNILNLPLISNFVNFAVAAAAGMYVAPKSMQIDLKSILQGDDIAKDTQAIGVMWIRIHKAVGLSKQDAHGSRGGGSDPYINLSFSKYGKPMYCTRVITDDLNPVWEEAAALLVTPELITADEQLSVELWDSDRNTADDVVGKVELSMQKMIQHPGKMYPHVSKLSGMQNGTDMPGELHWEVGYFGKPKFRPALRTDGKDPKLPKALADNPKFQDEKGRLDTEEADAVAHTPPDPLWPSGICSVIVHQIVNLELENIKGSDGNRKGKEFEPATTNGESTEEEGKRLPTSYCTILFNDVLVYRTRAKAVSSKPIFNAGTERFMRDWRSGLVTVTVRDQRNREHDPILGVIPLRLNEILTASSQVTRWYPLDGGIGFGRVRISLLFRSVEIRLPPHVLGWEVGTFEISSDRLVATGWHHYASIKLRTGGSGGKIRRQQCSKTHEGDGVSWDLSAPHHLPVRLPVKHRYRSPVIFEFHVPGKRGAAAYASIWLQHFVDNEITPIDIPIWTTKNGTRLAQNYITERNYKSKMVPGLEDLKEVGRLHFRGRFQAGTDESHRAFVRDNDSRETFETWEACFAEGVRKRVVSAEVPEHIQELHKKSLVQSRDVLMKAPEEERERWISSTGEDWSGAFGESAQGYSDGEDKKIAEPVPPPSDDDTEEEGAKGGGDASDHDLGITDATNVGTGGFSKRSVTNGRHSMASERTNGDHHPRPSTDSSASTSSGADSATTPSDPKWQKKAGKRAEKRTHRGYTQWRPARNLQFVKDEGVFGINKLKKRFIGDMSGREPGVETEA
ncbi:hypothetical protein DV738_g320, partial [Chaetothyriales sp. CBS 135597]